MPKLIIDDIAVEVADGLSVLEAALSVGIPIPHFCWHPALGKAGACRVCAVKMLDGPVKGIQMSCMLEVQDGMVVSTTDEEAVAMRRQVIEWLMINHPHDCPVCDEGGECQLQDFTIAGGHSLRRYSGKKRTYFNQQLGPFIEHEMNRCIQCYRCVRFYQDIAGGTDFGVMGTAERVYFGRAENGKLQSPFSGNIVDLCPTGVFTDKTSRFRARYWDYDMAPSVCPHCSLGCNTTPAAHYRELLKIIARQNDVVNGFFICDRGRFTNAAVNDPRRPRFPMVKNKEKSWQQAVDTLVENIRKTESHWGPESLAVIGSSRLSLEALSLLQPLSRSFASGSLCYFVDEEESEKGQEAVSTLQQLGSASMADVGRADLVVIACSNLIEDGPMMALAVRQAWKNGASVFISEADFIRPNVTALPFPVQSISTLEAIPLSDAENPHMICGTSNTPAEDIARLLGKGVLPVFLFDGPNGFATALLAREQGSISLSRAIAEKRVKGIIAVEADISPELLDKVDCIAALDWRDSDAVKAADIVLPTTAWVEMDGVYINNEGRAQRFKKVMDPGLPLKGLTPELHPPRGHSDLVPGGNVLPAWKIISDIISCLGKEKPPEPLSGRWRKIQQLAAGDPGVLVVPGEPTKTGKDNE